MKRSAILLVLFLLAAAPAVLACPACREALLSQTDPAQANRLREGYNSSIALLMGAPYLLFAGVTFLIVRSIRRTKP